MRAKRTVLAAAVLTISGLAVMGCSSGYSENDESQTGSYHAEDRHGPQDDSEWRAEAASGSDMAAQPAGSTVQPDQTPPSRSDQYRSAQPAGSQLPYDAHDADTSGSSSTNSDMDLNAQPAGSGVGTTPAVEPYGAKHHNDTTMPTTAPSGTSGTGIGVGNWSSFGAAGSSLDESAQPAGETSSGDTTQPSVPAK